MSSAEAAFSVTAKSPQGDLCTVRGDSYDDFRHNVTAAFGHDAVAVLTRFNGAFGATSPSEAQAVENVHQAFPAAQPAPVTTVGQPLPQPTQFAPTAAPAAPPNLPHPGNCAHGAPYTYKDSMARGKPWRRWECSQPWVKGNDAHNAQRCKAVNVDAT